MLGRSHSVASMDKAIEGNLEFQCCRGGLNMSNESENIPEGNILHKLK